MCSVDYPDKSSEECRRFYPNRLEDAVIRTNPIQGYANKLFYELFPCAASDDFKSCKSEDDFIAELS